MATLTDVSNRVRLELADLAQTFTVSLTGDGTTKVFDLGYYPLDAASVVAKVNNVTVAGGIEERSGRMELTSAPANGASIVVTGTHYRYFSPTDLTTIVSAAVDQHLANRTDDFGRKLSLTNLPVVEEYPVALLATVQALWALATDAAYDIDIHTPDGVSVPRSERFAQLMAMIQARETQYKELGAALGIGLWSLSVFTFRRISKATGRYVPVFMPQEIDDFAAPTRIFLPIPVYGSTPADEATAVYDITLRQGDTLTLAFGFGMDLTGYTVKAQARLVPNSPALSAEFTCVITDAPAGHVTVSLTPTQTTNLPMRTYWDLQITNTISGDVQTLVAGLMVAERDVTH